MATIGYMRVSTSDQNYDLQRDALTAAGCDRIYQDLVSGCKETRQGLSDALAALQGGDTFVVWRLDRLGRSLVHLVTTVNGLESRGVGFRSLQEGFDTTHNGGRLVFHIFAALAEFERGVIRERTAAGLASARARGRVGGRPSKLDPRKVEMARTLLSGGAGMSEVAEALSVHQATLYRYLASDRSAPFKG
jgi:DNA invertase Pin-like site-specific DNA recombinase